jgi:hypothetical protein
VGWGEGAIPGKVQLQTEIGIKSEFVRTQGSMFQTTQYANRANEIRR